MLERRQADVVAWNALQGSWWVGALLWAGSCSVVGEDWRCGKDFGARTSLRSWENNIDSGAQSWTSPCGEMFLFCKRIRWKFVGFWSNYIQV